ncbi:uncharacterized protein [Clinocottus analis]|uniref:uncharacterized protein n=1 Tax=Clinocottus analis TaxID=304258 RepID=UPI0035C081CB
MESFNLITACLLSSLSWISVSVSESQTLKVQPGKEVTLTCNNISNVPTDIEWFRLSNRSELSCISSMYGFKSDALFCDGFQHGFEMSANISNVFLKIKRVDSSDSGRYFCGFYVDKHTIFTNVTNLIVQGDGESDGEINSEIESKEPDGTTELMSVMLAGLSVFLTIVVVVLAVKIRKLQTAVKDKPQPERNKDLGSEELNYVALNFQAKPKRSRRPPRDREMELNVVYAATR